MVPFSHWAGRHRYASHPALRAAASHAICNGRTRPFADFNSAKTMRCPRIITQSGKPGSDLRESWVWLNSQEPVSAHRRTARSSCSSVNC